MRLGFSGIVAIALLVSAVGITGCSDSSTPPAPPGIQPEIINILDSFEYQIQSIESYSGTASYMWENSGPVAAVDHSSVITGGVGTVVVMDAAGTQVYSGALVSSGSILTQAGTAGSWRVTVTYATFTGTVNFRVQKG